MIAFILHRLNVFLGLLTRISNATFILRKLGNELFLVRNFLFESPDLAILCHLIFLSGFHLGLQSFDFSSQFRSIAFYLFSLCIDGSLLVFLSLDTHVGFIQLLMNLILCCFNSIGFVNDFLNGRSTTLKCEDIFILLSAKLVVNSNYLIALFNGLVDVSFSDGNFLFIFLLVLGKFGTFEVRLDCQPQSPPKPGFTNSVISNCTLKTVEGQFLILHFLEDKSRCLSSCLSLQ